MKELFRDLAVHQAKVYRSYLDSWSQGVPEEKLGPLVEGLVYDGLWLVKFPLLYTPTYGVKRLDALNKAPVPDPAEVLALRPLVDADIVRFVLSLKPDALENRVEIFFGGRAMNKPLWNYLATWFERSAVLRSRVGEPQAMLDTVYR